MTDDAYPRPQLRRRRWRSLNGRWRFAFAERSSEPRPRPPTHWPHEILVPFAPESARSGIGDQGFHPICWYEREFELEALAALEALEAAERARVLLHFGAVDYQACVWVNDVLVAEHEGGHTPFSADITEALTAEGPQRLRVLAIDDPADLEKPRGKQDWRLEPHGIWYPRTTGIWQTVWLEPVGATYLRQLRWTPNIEHWEIAFSAFLAGLEDPDLRIGVVLRVGERILASDTYAVVGGEVHRRIGLSDPGIDDYRNELLWSPESPTLIEAHITLLKGGLIIDELESYTALRSIGARREKILLNGRPYPLHLVLDQGYWPETLMTAPSDAALKRDVELARAMGFNGVRKHQKIEDPRYLYWADVLGLLVFGEMPSAYRFTAKSIERTLREWTEVIERDVSHPCIVIWVPFNESWGVPELPNVPPARDAVAAFYHLTKTLDPSRLVIGNDGWESTATDVIGIHDYDNDPEHVRVRYGPEVKPQEVVDRRWTGGRLLTLDGYPHRGQPIMLTEFGGIAYTPRHDLNEEDSWGYSRAKSAAEYERMCCELISAVRTAGLFSGYCYTQFADTFQEANGLLFADRTPKLPLASLAKAVRGERRRMPGQPL